MAVIPAGNGTDPWTMLQQYVQNQERQREQNIRGEEFALQRRYGMAQLDRGASDMYKRTRAVGEANIDNAQSAIDAGFDPAIASGRGTSGRNTGTRIYDRKNAVEFTRGLSEGGINGPLQLAAILGHGQVESSFNTGAVGDRGTGMTSHGIMQWRDRFPALQRFAAQHNRPWTDPYIQGRFAAHELQTTEKKAGDMLMNAKNPTEANAAMLQYLRMRGWNTGDPIHQQERMNGMLYWAKNLGAMDANQVKMYKANGTGEPNILTDETGRRYTYEYPRLSYIDGLTKRGFEGNPEYSKIAKRYKFDGSGPRNSKGEFPHRYYLDDEPDPIPTKPVTSVQTAATAPPAGGNMISAQTPEVTPEPIYKKVAKAPFEEEETEEQKAAKLVDDSEE